MPINFIPDQTTAPAPTPTAQATAPKIDFIPDTQTPDMSGVAATVHQNLSQQSPQEPSSASTSFAQRLDTGMGMPVSSALANKNQTIRFTPDMRVHLTNAYKAGTATDAADFMHSAIPASSSVVGSFARGALKGTAPAAAGFAAFGPGFEAGAGATAMTPLPEMAGPAAPLVIGAGGLIGGTVSSFGGAGLVQGVENKMLHAFPSVAKAIGLSPEQQKADIEQHPTAEFAGQLAPNLLFMRPGNIKSLATVGGAAIGGGVEAGKEAIEGKGYSPEKIALSAAAGGLLNKPTSLGESLSSSTSSAIGDLRELIGSKINKPASAVTDADITDAINPLKNNEPTAEAFTNTAKVMGVNEDTLHTVYNQTGLHPDQVQADASANPEIMDSLKNGEFPPAYVGMMQHPNVGEDTAIKTPQQVQATTGLANRIVNMIPQTVRDFASNIKDDFLKKTVPMAAGSKQAQAVAKDFANNVRFHQLWGQSMFDYLGSRYNDQELSEMWNAIDEANSRALKYMDEGMTKEEAMQQVQNERAGHFDLPQDQQDIISAMTSHANELLQQAKDVGMFKGENLPFWTPRMAAKIGEDGEWGGLGTPEKVSRKPGIGKNVSTFASSLLRRKYRTSAETEAAMQEHGGELVRDIRTMPLALGRLGRAIAARSMIKQLAEMSNNAGGAAVSYEPHDGYFTLDHPAFQTYRPKLSQDAAGEWSVVRDENGEPIFEKQPIYISKEFEGPLDAVLSHDSGAIYKALMSMKGSQMALIMYSPLIHNIVEFGRALPYVPGKVITGRVYFEGNAFRRGIPYDGVFSHIGNFVNGNTAHLPPDLSGMEEAVKNGFVPIGHNFQKQDISSIMDEGQIEPGKGNLSKALGWMTDKVLGKSAGTQVRKAVDSTLNFYHNTLLWDRVADLQAGLYVHMRDELLSQKDMAGNPKYTRQAASAISAHFANRFAGALPVEAMSNTARKMANLLMFSRTFTFGNLGVIKDAMTGLPSDVMAQLERDIGPEDANDTRKLSRRIALSTVALDMGLGIVTTSLLQDAFDHFRRDKTLSDIEQGYVSRVHALLQKVDNNASTVFMHPLDALQSISSTSENEQNKINRAWFGNDETGTRIYARNVVGKIGEEYMNWLNQPITELRVKSSPIVSPIIDMLSAPGGKDIWGNRIEDPNASNIDNIGRVVKHFMEAQLPTQAAQEFDRIIHGEADETEKAKFFGPLFGVTFSRGYPGGAVKGEISQVIRNHYADLDERLPQIRQDIKDGKLDEARAVMTNLNMTSHDQHNLIKHYQHPGFVSSYQKKEFERYATEEEKAKLQQFEEEDQSRNP